MRQRQIFRSKWAIYRDQRHLKRTEPVLRCPERDNTDGDGPLSIFPGGTKVNNEWRLGQRRSGRRSQPSACLPISWSPERSFRALSFARSPSPWSSLS